MPSYCYTCESCGEQTVRVCVITKRKRVVKCASCGAAARRDIAAEHRDVAHHPGNWPQLSEAAGVAHDQVGAAYAKSVKDGVPTQFTSDGRAIFTSAKHRRQYCESVGLYDRNAGYSDPRRLRHR